MKRMKRSSEEEAQVIMIESGASSAPVSNLSGFSDVDKSDPRAIWFDTEVYPDTVSPIIEQIISINYEDDRKEKEYAIDGQTYTRTPIKLYVSSYGGSCYDGLGLIGAMKSSKTPVHTYAVGKVMSMGLFIAVSGHKRFSYPFTTYMYHSVSSFAFGKFQELKEDVEEVERLQTLVDDHLISVSSFTKEQIQDIHTRKQDYYIDATKALEFNMVDEII